MVTDFLAISRAASTIDRPVVPSMTPRTFRAISQSPAHRKQNLVFGSPIKNPFESPLSTSKSSIASISPTNLNRRVSSLHRLSPAGRASPLPRQSPAGSLASQGSPHKGVQDFRSSMTQIREASSETVRNQTWWDNHQKEDAVSSWNKRRISDKIDKFMQAEIMKKTQDAKEATKSVADVVVLGRESAPAPGRGGVVASLRKSFESQRSRVTDMKRIFDGTNSARPSIIVPTTDEHPRPVAKFPENKSTPQKKRDPKNSTPSKNPSPTRLLVFPPRYSTEVKSKVSLSKTLDQSPSISIISKTQQLKESPTRLAPLNSSKPQAKSKTIGERMKIFEKSTTVDEPKPQESKRRAFGRKINRSLKSLFESHSPGKSEDGNGIKAKHTPWGSKRDKYKGSMTGKEVKAVVNEFQDDVHVSPTRKTGTTGKAGTLGKGSRWLQMGQDGTQSADVTPTKSTTVSEHEMIIKEVECGLKHPRPQRGTELVTMMALCREKVGMGSLRYKEKEKVAKVGAKSLG